MAIELKEFVGATPKSVANKCGGSKKKSSSKSTKKSPGKCGK